MSITDFDEIWSKCVIVVEEISSSYREGVKTTLIEDTIFVQIDEISVFTNLKNRTFYHFLMVSPLSTKF